MARKACKALWQASYIVEIRKGTMRDKHYFWVLNTPDNIGIASMQYQNDNEYCMTPQQAIDNFKEFAEANLIADYEIRSSY